MKSYSSETSWWDFFKEAQRLYFAKLNDAEERVGGQIAEIRKIESIVKERFGLLLKDLDILEIGPGQFLTQLTYLAKNNNVVGSDLDIIAHGYNPLVYLKMFRLNGLRRTIKTVGRKLVGIDRKYDAELKRQLGTKQMIRPRVVQSDVCNLEFPDVSFNFVYCRSVLHHVPEPLLAIKEIARVLKPGGVAYISIHLYSSETGALDPRRFSEEYINDIRGWPHLRPELLHTVKSNAFLNKLRLGQWQAKFEAEMPGVLFILNESSTDNVRIREAALALKKTGELSEYSLEELVTFELLALWKKPDLQANL